MKIVFFAHPIFLGSRSMLRFSKMLADGMEQRGHQVEIWKPEPVFTKVSLTRLKKWLGYIDQYLVFPFKVKSKLRYKHNKVLYVITDHALGPYVPLIANRPHVIHCHDFLAQRSALGQIEENPTSFTGKQYQSYIRNGYRKGKNFISISNRTREDLHNFLTKEPLRSEMVYNGLSSEYFPRPVGSTRTALTDAFNIDLSKGYLLHVGGNQWYKNREGILLMYEQWRRISISGIPMLFIGQQPSASLLKAFESSSFKESIHFLTGVNDSLVHLAYSGATAFLFPSLAEGFGWPIAEAMASGTIVLTTNEAPMSEVGGSAAFYIDRRPFNPEQLKSWTNASANKIEEMIQLNQQDRDSRIRLGIDNARRFNLEEALDKIEAIYTSIVNDTAYQNKGRLLNS